MIMKYEYYVGNKERYCIDIVISLVKDRLQCLVSLHIGELFLIGSIVQCIYSGICGCLLGR